MFTGIVFHPVFTLCQAQEAVKPVDPIAARLEAVNKASAIMANAVKPSGLFFRENMCN